MAKLDIYKFLMTLALVVTFIGCDQATKYIAKESLYPYTSVPLIHGTLYLEYAENPGAALSLGAALPAGIRFWILTVFSGIVLLMLLVYLLMSHSLHWSRVIALSLIVGGGVGNLLDRLLNNGRVIDFMLISVGRFHTGIFNLADFSVLLGVIMLFFQLLLQNRSQASQT